MISYCCNTFYFTEHSQYAGTTTLAIWEGPQFKVELLASWGAATSWYGSEAIDGSKDTFLQQRLTAVFYLSSISHTPETMTQGLPPVNKWTSTLISSYPCRIMSVCISPVPGHLWTGLLQRQTHMAWSHPSQVQWSPNQQLLVLWERRQTVRDSLCASDEACAIGQSRRWHLGLMVCPSVSKL